MALSLDGLVSGMDTTGLIQQLMQIEAMPRTALKNKVAVQNKAVASYQAVNTKMASLLNAAKAASDPKTWTAMKATSTSDAAAVTAAPGATAGALTFKVDRLAAAHTMTYGGRVSSLTDATAAPVMSGSTIDVLRADGTTTTVTPTDASLQSVVNAINGTANAAYKAAAVQVAPGQYSLQLTAATTGGTSAFANASAAAAADADADGGGTYVLTGLDELGSTSITTQGVDAKLTVGTATTYTMTSTSNTFTDIIPGVTVTATRVQSATDAPVTVSVGADKDGIAAKVQALFESINVALGEMKMQSATKTETTSAGTLVGDPAVRQLTQDILSAVGRGAGALGSFKSVGIELDKKGNLSFDKQKFLDSYAADPVKTQKFFDSYDNVAGGRASTLFEPGHDTAHGLARKLEVIGLKATEGIALPTDPINTPKEGLLTGLIQRRNDFVKDLNKQVESWDLRLDKREAALKKQFSGFEVTLGKLRQQSSWLSGQLASLPSPSAQ
ncbi:flagellar hook-associated protein 2 [Micromonospora pattaloongensis]|uniref:Flagellar hook-associated protein 2 n=1 Tax=Micromonospora pattaloongensis TaxID=405436 RepID=A0A1H3MXD8_9ACTN|nr:flagellar filament capping protein FliD [Micromonospora pattaloongensis]SDY80905.1 flagellar hook-associated protein 2 [Micromonospora pattaloongensis]